MECSIIFLLAMVATISAEESYFVSSIEHYMSTALGVNDIERSIYKARQSKESIEANSLVRDIENDLSAKLENVATSVTELKAALEGETETLRVKAIDCCSYDSSEINFVYDQRFREEVDFSAACLLRTERSDTVNLQTNKMLNLASKSKAKYTIIRHQRYIDQSGVMVQYPAFKLEPHLCDRNNKENPWYVSAVLSGNKNIVVVVEASAFEKHFQETLEALENVFHTTSAYDNIALVAFSDSVILPIDKNGAITCDEKKMIPASHDNKNAIFKFLKSKQWRSGNYNYGLGLGEAFDYLDSVGDSKKKNIILFIAASSPSDSKEDIVQTITDRNGNSVTILTYGISGSDQVLKEIAESGTTDYHRSVTQASDLKKVIHLYFEHVPTSSYDTVQWSWPSNDDKWSTGPLVTASQGVVVDGTFRGALSVDVQLSSLADEIVNSKVNEENAYAFILDKDFRVLVHPFLPIAFESELPVVDIRTLEKSDDLAGLLSKITNALQSNTPSAQTETLVMKASWKENLNFKVSEIKLYDSKVSCKVTAYSIYVVCVVVKQQNNEVTRIHDVTRPDFFNFHYHRFDLIAPEKTCLFYEKVSFFGTTVKFTPKAFQDTNRYSSHNETIADIEAYFSALLESDDSSAIFTEQAIQDIFLTFNLEKIWNKTDYETEDPYDGKLTMWKYVGTSNGVFRIWPGVQLPREFDHTTRPWYQTALAQKDKIFIITYPYMDVVTEHWIISFAKAITIESSSELYGVIGFDIPIWDIGHLLEMIEERCHEACALISQPGYSFYHPDMIDNNEDYKFHFMEFEPVVSKSLIDDKILVKERCYQPESRSYEEFYGFDLKKLPVYNGNYDIEVLSGTNAILLRGHESYYDWSEESCEVKLRSECRNVDKCQSPCKNITEPSCTSSGFVGAICNPYPPHIKYYKKPFEDWELYECFDKASWEWLKLVLELGVGIPAVIYAVYIAKTKYHRTSGSGNPFEAAQQGTEQTPGAEGNQPDQMAMTAQMNQFATGYGVPPSQPFGNAPTQQSMFGTGIFDSQQPGQQAPPSPFFAPPNQPPPPSYDNATSGQFQNPNFFNYG